MILFLKIAFLNVLRNTRRTTITVLAIVFGSVSLIVFGGFVESMYEGLKESRIRSSLGHMQVFKKGFEEFGSSDPEKYMLPQETVSKIFEIVESQPEVEIVTPRINFSGLLSNGRTSVGILGLGVDADKEGIMNSSVTILAGQDLFPDDLESALIGEGLAKSIDAKAGDWLTLLASTTDGAVNAVDLQVAGIMSTGIKEIDDRFIRANLPHIRSLINTDAVTRIVILLDETERTEAVKSRLEKLFSQKGLDTEIRIWSDLDSFYHKVVRLFNYVFRFIKVIVMAIVVLGIANTMMMAVMERTKEIGTIRAMGNTGKGIVGLFLTEALYLGIIGGIIGIIAGILAAKGITGADLMMPPPPGSTTGFPIRVKVIYSILAESFALGLCAAIISSLYPAFKAARLKIADALRFV